jgi:hypothetical protein
MHGEYGNWHPTNPAKNTVPQVAKVNTNANNSICARGTYQPPEGRTCDTVTARVYNNAMTQPPATPPMGSGTVTVNYNPQAQYNYDFSGANVVPGVANGASGNEPVVKIALWAHLTATGGAAGYDQVYAYNFLGRTATATDCG